MTTAKRLLPLLLLLAVLGGGYALGLQHWLSWPVLAARQAELHQAVMVRPFAAAGLYVLIYAAAVAVSFPGAVVLTIAGGLLFGVAQGTALAVCGATLGAVTFFLAARTALRPLLARRAGKLLERLRPGMENNGFSYVLALRLVPVVPFWLINIAAALGGVRLSAFTLATLLGIVPAGAVYASVGAGIGDVLAAGGRPDLSVILSPPVLLPLLGLAALAVLPQGWRWWRRRHPPERAEGG